MSQTFACPNCTANLAHDGGNHLTVRCPYCNSTVVVPESLRPQVHRQEFAPLLAQQAKLQEIIRLINMDDIEQAVHHFMNTFGVDANTAADAVERLAAGLSLAHQHTFTRQGQQTHSSGAGCQLKGFVALIVLVVIGSVVLPLLGGTAVLWSVLYGDGEPGAAQNIPEIIDIT
jgi:phage FluMu protein Com